MVYKQDNIQSLVDKYWDGQTSLEEEAVLRDYFRYNDYPEQFNGVASYFEMMATEEDALGKDFDAVIMEKVDGKQPGGRVISFHAAARYLAAACVALLIGTAVWYAFQEPTTIPEPVAVTLDDPEVKAAFEQTRSALMMVGQRLNEGKEQAVKLNKFNEATEVMKENQQ